MPIKLTIFAEFALITAHALTFAAHAVTVSIAVGHLAFVVTQRALFALPAGIALTFAVDVFTALRAQNRTNACVEV